MRLIARIVRRGLGDLLLAAEALVLLTFFRVCLVLLPVRRIVGGTEGQLSVVRGRERVPAVSQRE